MKNAKKIGILMLTVLFVLIVLIISMLFIKNKEVERIASTEENKRKAELVTGTTDSRFQYAVNSEDETTITLFYYIGSDTNVVIPAYIDGYKVTGITGSFYEKYDSTAPIRNVEYLTFPSTLENMNTSSNKLGTYMKVLSNLKSITVDSNNANYSSEDGVLYNKDKTELLYYPIDKETAVFTIPNTVEKISSEALGFCYNLITVTIPENVISIRKECI